ncbi:hypothetical protein psb1_003 [Shigella phage pSb-1]|uniref:Uncharacterized protein n=1 Tax=Shigella phage pSb-1 TaxID=1414738 RepID=V5UPI3_9CAUD|nr:hypothetical protein psb1_003 [Shigella phage pSb-1]AHB79421.1 hypothetical protein psb1_003 [Shigella phage pSb-1]
MDLSFLTGNQTPQPAAMSWMSNNNQNFNTPAMNYNPGAAIGMGTNLGVSTLLLSCLVQLISWA